MYQVFLVWAHRRIALRRQLGRSTRHRLDQRTNAPVVVCNKGGSNFPAIMKFVARTNRSTFEGKFASRFRSRAFELESELADELIRVYKEWRSTRRSAIASEYCDSLPYVKRKDTNRKRTYLEFIQKRRAEKSRTSASKRRECGNQKRESKVYACVKELEAAKEYTQQD